MQQSACLLACLHLPWDFSSPTLLHKAAHLSRSTSVAGFLSPCGGDRERENLLLRRGGLSQNTPPLHTESASCQANGRVRTKKLYSALQPTPRLFPSSAVSSSSASFLLAGTHPPPPLCTTSSTMYRTEQTEELPTQPNCHVLLSFPFSSLLPPFYRLFHPHPISSRPSTPPLSSRLLSTSALPLPLPLLPRLDAQSLHIMDGMMDIHAERREGRSLALTQIARRDSRKKCVVERWPPRHACGSL